MTIWKKAISAVTSAALLASLLATSAFAAPPPNPLPAYQTTKLLVCTGGAVVGAAGCSQVADGRSLVVLTRTDDSTGTSGSHVEVTGAVFSVADAPFVWESDNLVTAAADSVESTVGKTITVRAPAAAGTATVSYFKIAAGTGVSTLEGTLTITFTATSGLAVSEANSIVKTVAADATAGTCATAGAKSSGAATPSGAVQAQLCVTLKNANGGLVSGATVTATITPVGLVNSSQTATSAPTGADGVAIIPIQASGLAGIASIAISVKDAGATVTTFAPKTFTFAGALATLTVTQTKYAVAKGTVVATPATPYKIGTVAGKDSAGNATACNTLWVAKSGSTSILPDANLDVVDVAGVCEIHIIGTYTPATLGSTAITVQSADFTIKAAPITFYVSDVVATVTVKFGVATINPGGSTTITVEAKDSAGRPVADGTATNLIVSAGDYTPKPPTTSNGVSTATYLAPFNHGVVTALASVGSTPITASATATVGLPVNPAALGSTASALGVPGPRGPWSTTTKVAKVGEFITWRIAAGAANAGKTIGIFLQTKDANGVWSAPVRFSARVADSSGNAYFSWKGTKAMWVSIRGGLGDARSTPPVQGRWQ